MPTYDYECDACDHKFEEFQSMMDEPLKKCPKCGKKKLRRLLGAGAAFIFKGSGFYQTDYRSESYKSSAKAEEAKAGAKPGKCSSDCPCNTSAGSGKSACQDTPAAKSRGKDTKSST